jgi:hypothetical protein
MKRAFAIGAVLLALGTGLWPAESGPKKDSDQPPDGDPKKYLDQKGELTRDDPFDVQPTQRRKKVFDYKMQEGKSYLIELTSPAFDVALRVETAAGAKVGTGATPTGNFRNAKLLVTAATTDTYKIIVSSNFDNNFGAFTLKVLEEAGKAEEHNDKLTEDDQADKNTVPTYTRRYPLKMAEKGFYVVELQSAAFAGLLRIEDSRGIAVASARSTAAGKDAKVVFQPTKTDTYDLVVTTVVSNATGPFTLSVAQPAKDPGPTGLVKADTLAATDPLDTALTRCRHKVYERELEAQQTYVIEMASTVFQPYLRLEDRQGKPLLQNGGAALARLVFTPAKTEGYRIIAASRDADRTGPYELRILTDAKAPGGTVNGKFDDTDPFYHVNTGAHAKLSTLKMLAGKRYVFELGSAAFNARLIVEDSAGRLVADTGTTGDARDVRFVFAPPATDTYKVALTSTAPGQSGLYNFGVFSGPATPAPTFTKDDALDAKDTLDKYPTGKFHKSFEVDFSAGKAYEIDMSSPELDSYLYLEDPKGQVVAQDDGGETRNARIRIPAAVTGKYRVIATTATRELTGPFTLRVKEVIGTKPGAALLTKDDILTTREPFYAVPTSYYKKQYDLKLEAKKTYQILMHAKTFAPHLRLEDAQRNILGEWSGGKGEPATLIFTCPKTGVYQLVASTTERLATGPFQVSVEPLALEVSGAGNLTLDDPPALLPTAWRQKTFTEALDAGKTYLFRLTGDDAELALEALPPGKTLDLATVEGQKSPSVVVTPEQAGKYTLVALGKRTGPLTLEKRVLRTDKTQKAVLETKDPFDVQPVSRYRKAYTKDLAGDSSYIVTMRSDNFDTSLRVEDAQGKLLPYYEMRSGMTTTLIVAPPGKTTCTIVATSRKPMQTGTFNLDLRPLTTDLSKAEALATSDPLDALPTGAKRKVYEYAMEAGKSYAMIMLSFSINPQLRLEDSKGQRVATTVAFPKAQAQMFFTPQRNDTYRVIATTTNRQLGPFILTMRGYQPALEKTAQLTADDSFEVLPTEKFCKTYTLEMKQGVPYAIEMNSKPFDAYLRLEDATGKQLQFHDSGGPNKPARIVFFPPKTDKYKIIATSYQTKATGTFTVTVGEPRTVSTTEGKLTADDFFDPLQNNSYQKIHEFKLKGGQRYIFGLESKQFRPFLRVESAKGKHLKREPDTRNFDTATLAFVPPQDGTYRVVVTSDNPAGIGAYKLTLQQ